MKHSIIENFSKAAGIYDAHATLQAGIAETLWQQCMPYFTPAMSILDAGCGTAQLWSKHRANVMGIDGAFEMCRRSRTHITSVNGSLESLPFADESFDLVFSSYAMQWTESLQQAMAELMRVLKRGGVLALAVPVEGTLRELQESFLHAGLVPHVMAFHIAHRYEEMLSRYHVISHHNVQNVRCYDSPHLLVRAIKQIGAATPVNPTRKGLMTPRQWKKIESYYRTHYANGEQVTSSWNTLMMLVRK